ncbi:hypothetical protein GUJ93_ZPchr0001g31951 [Zizania palustris]|uniref:DAGKc domain-containing protein n=1 Tax=Zizania palustris TaxID=103762 RepID=A0A8J5RAG8_ZIZPA|nr:hypothetical protein GUJ93_ZPchr0001g31951 [Zizania palustris]
MNVSSGSQGHIVNGGQKQVHHANPPILNNGPKHRLLTPMRQCRGVACVVIILSTAFTLIVYIAPITTFLVRLFSVHYSRKMTSILFGMWLSLWPFLFEKINKTNVVFSGEIVPPKKRVLLFANHRTEVDWMYLWDLALRKGHLGYIKYILKSSLMKLPVFSWAFHIFEFIPVERKWEIDETIIQSKLSKFKDPRDPLWLAVFPEGTDYTEKKCIKSQEYASEHGLPILENVLLPKTKGFICCLQELKSSLDAVYDVTIAYKHRLPDFLDNVYGTDPSEVHIHIRTVKLCDIPTSEDELTDWMIERFRQKDQLLSDFFIQGHFPDEGTEGDISTLECLANFTAIVSLTGIFLYLSLFSSIWFKFCKMSYDIRMHSSCEFITEAITHIAAAAVRYRFAGSHRTQQHIDDRSHPFSSSPSPLCPLKLRSARAPLPFEAPKPSPPPPTRHFLLSAMGEGDHCATAKVRVNGAPAQATLCTASPGAGGGGGPELRWRCGVGTAAERVLSLDADVLGVEARGKEVVVKAFVAGAARSLSCAPGSGKGGRKRRRRDYVFEMVAGEDAAAAWGDRIRDCLDSLGRPKRLFILVNPFGGKKCAKKIYEAEIKPLFEAADVNITMQETKYQGHAREVVSSLDLAQYDGIVCVSGDGVLVEVVNGILQRNDWEEAIKIPIGVVPAGTGNGMAKSLLHAAGQTYSVPNAAFAIIRGYRQSLDVCTILQGEKKFFSVLLMTWGLVADIDIESEKYRWMGSARFDVYVCMLLHSAFSIYFQFFTRSFCHCSVIPVKCSL